MTLVSDSFGHIITKTVVILLTLTVLNTGSVKNQLRTPMFTFYHIQGCFVLEGSSFEYFCGGRLVDVAKKCFITIVDVIRDTSNFTCIIMILICYYRNKSIL